MEMALLDSAIEGLAAAVVMADANDQESVDAVRRCWRNCTRPCPRAASRRNCSPWPTRVSLWKSDSVYLVWRPMQKPCSPSRMPSGGCRHTLPGKANRPQQIPAGHNLASPPAVAGQDPESSTSVRPSYRANA